MSHLALGKSVSSLELVVGGSIISLMGFTVMKGAQAISYFGKEIKRMGESSDALWKKAAAAVAHVAFVTLSSFLFITATSLMIIGLVGVVKEIFANILPNASKYDALIAIIIGGNFAIHSAKSF